MFRTKTCEECGQVFLLPVQYTYKIKNKISGKMIYYCSYKCWRKNGGDNNHEKFIRH